MICICCGKEIGKNQVVGFMFGDNPETYPVCKTCMDKLTKATQKEIETTLENYTPGIIEEML